MTGTKRPCGKQLFLALRFCPVLALVLSVSVACRGQSRPNNSDSILFPLPPTLNIIPASASVNISQTQQFEISMRGQTASKIVWSLVQSGVPCDSRCGSIVANGQHATYTAPSVVPQPPIVTLVATLVAEFRRSVSATIAVVSQPIPSVSVSLTPSAAVLSPSETQQLQATVSNDLQNEGVRWDLTESGVSCSPACGSIIGSTAQTAIYAAPTMVAGTSLVLITATSIAEPTQSASAAVAVTAPVPTGSDGSVDITAYGARSVAMAPTATASCVAGSTSVSLSNSGWPQDVTQFKNGDSIRLDRCGQPTTMTQPTGLSVSPGMNAGGTPAVSGLALGTTGYTYEVIACDKAGGCSAASSPASTTLGAALLGRVSAQIVQMSLSNNVLTVTTTKPHGFAQNALVYIQYFSTHTAAFEGFYIIHSVPNATTFTFLTSLDSRIGGTPTLDASGGVAVAFNCNVLSWNPVQSAWKYFIYGRDSSGMTLIGVAEPGTTTWQDYGEPMMDHFSFPSFVPTAPPSQATAQYLLTRISSGGGTALIAVEESAGNSATNVLARMGSDAAILAAFSAARERTVLIPDGTYQVAGYLDLHSQGPINVEQAGILQIADTVQIPGGMHWTGIGANSLAQFAAAPTSQVTGLPGSYPTIYLGAGTGGQAEFDYLALVSSAGNGTLLFYADAGVSLTFNNVQFLAGGGTYTGYMNRQLIFRTGGFDYNFSNCLFSADQEPTGQITDIGYTFLPSVLFAPNGSNPTGNFQIQDSWFVGKSAIEVNASTAGGGDPYNEFDRIQTQNDLLPVFVASNYPLQNTVAARTVYFNGIAPADYPSALTGNWAVQPLTVGLQNLSNLPTGSRPLFVGNPTTLVGQGGGVASSGSGGGGWFANGDSGVGYLLPPPASPPLLTLKPGGAVPIGNHNYQVAWIDAFGNSTTVGPAATINVTSGMQTVAVTPPTAPDGAVKWQYYRDGSLGTPTTAGCFSFDLSASEYDVLGFTCGNSPPSQNTALSSGQGANGEETTAIVLTGGGHKNVISGTFSADRALVVPDVSGTIAVKIASGSVTMPTDAIAPSICGAVISAAATGVLATDVVHLSPNGTPSLDVDLRLKAWAGTNSVNFQYCNSTTSSINPLAATYNWQVVR